MVTWYEVSRWSDRPRAVEFERETDKFLIRKNGRRDAKATMYSRWYATKKEAEAVISSRIAAEEAKKADMLIRNASRDLLEALERLVSAARDVDHGYMDQAISSADSAIARARGEA